MKRGRPKQTLVGDPDRYLMALALSFKALGMSMRGGCEAAIATTEGLPVGDNPRHHGRAWHGGRGLGLLDWRYRMKPRPGAAATIEGRARGIRRKLKVALREAGTARWLYQMSNLWLFAMQRATEPDPGKAEAALLSMARLIGEEAFACEHLLELLRLTRAVEP